MRLRVLPLVLVAVTVIGLVSTLHRASGESARRSWVSVGAPSVSPEHAVDAPALGGAIVAEDDLLACASTTCLAVWNELNVATFAIRIGADGVPLDPQPTMLTTASINDLRVASDGSNFLVAWGSQSGHFALRVSAATGAALDSAPIQVTDRMQFGFDLASDGINYLLVWSDPVPNEWIRGARIAAANGALLDGPPTGGGFLISSAGSNQEFPSLAFDGTNYVTAWRDSRGATYSIYAARVRPDGSLVDGNAATGGVQVAPQPAPPESVEQAKLATGVGRDLVCWLHLYGGPPPTKNAPVECRRLQQANLTPLDPIALVVSPPTRVGGYIVASDGADFLVAHNDTLDGFVGPVVARRLRGADGVLLDPLNSAPRILDPVGVPGGAVFVGGNYLVAYGSQIYQPAFEEFTARVRPADGVILNPGGVLVSRGKNAESYRSSWNTQAAGSDGANFFVAWNDTRVPGLDGDLLGERIDGKTLLAIDATPVAIGTGTRSQDAPAVAFDGKDYLVAWQTYRTYPPGAPSFVFASRVSATTGAVLDGPAGLALGSGYTPTAACDLGNCLVSFIDGNGTGSAIVGKRIRAQDGVILDSAVIAIASDTTSNFGSASDGANFMVVSALGTSVRARRVRSADGAVLDPNGILIADGGSPSCPSASFDGTNFFVTWGDYGSGAVRAARVARDGTLLDGPPTALGIRIATGQCPISTSFDGKSHVIAWVTEPTVRGGRVTKEGVLLDPAPDGGVGGFPIAAPTGAPVSLGGTAGNAAGRALIAYSYSVATPLPAKDRVFVRAVDDDLGVTCGAVASCSSGFCVDGVCCDSTCGGGSATDCIACSVATGAAADGVCGPVASSRVCRPSVVTCVLDAKCDGVSSVCPANSPAPPGSPCPGGACIGGSCVADAGVGDAAPNDAASGGGDDDASLNDAAGDSSDAPNDGGGGSGEQGGCGCRLAPLATAQTHGGLAGLLVAMGLAVRRRRCYRRR